MEKGMGRSLTTYPSANHGLRWGVLANIMLISDSAVECGDDPMAKGAIVCSSREVLRLHSPGSVSVAPCCEPVPGYCPWLSSEAPEPRYGR